jgi:uncharacterized membrane protein HdeD (DUF308 family)
LLVLVGTYLLAAFSGAKLATEIQVVLFALVVLATLVARLVAAYRTPDRPEPRLLEDVDGPGDDEDRD